MSNNLNSPEYSPQLGPLSVGNVISAGLRIYRDHFKSYFSLAFIGCFWLLVPIYGWAKYASILGLLSRLAFSQVSERPETVEEARRHINPRMWNFFLAGILVTLIFIGALFGAIVVIAIAGIVIGVIVGQEPSAAGIAIGVLLGIVAFVGLFFGYIWLYSRLSLVELPIAIEEDVDASISIGRSWELTKAFVWRLQLIFLVATLITIPISLVINIINYALQIVFFFMLKNDPIFMVLYYVLYIGLLLASSAVLTPFWQTIKAVIYYDLRSRKEGMGLQLRGPR